MIPSAVERVALEIIIITVREMYIRIARQRLPARERGAPICVAGASRYSHASRIAVRFVS